MGNYGYPYCYPIWDTDVPDNEELRVGDVFSVTQNGTFNDTTCQEEYVPPRLVFPAHTSPLDLLFSEDGETLYISFRGSCKPTPKPQPPLPSHPTPSNTLDKTSSVGKEC